MMPLNREQIEALLKPINPKRIKTEGGQAHVPAYDVAAHLTRILGFGGWDTDGLSYQCVAEDFEERTKGTPPKPYKVWTVAYVASIRLTIKDSDGEEVAHYANGAGGDAINQPSRGDAHHLAMTTAISTALKRCAAFGLGDQFGLSLYNKGNPSVLVGTILGMAETSSTGAAPDLESHIPTPESLGNDEREGAPEAFLGSDEPPAPPVTRSDGLSDLQAEIRAHPKYKAMASTDKGKFLADSVGFEVASIKSLSDDSCEQILAALR